MISIAKGSSGTSSKVGRNRIVYSLFLLLTIISGLSSRYYSNYLPPWVQLYLGDALWALMVFLLIGFIFHRQSTWVVAIAAIVFSYCIELSQLYHSPWIDALRSNLLGGLILGFGFLWSDLMAYTAGIALGYIMEKILLRDKGVRWINRIIKSTKQGLC